MVKLHSKPHGNTPSALAIKTKTKVSSACPMTLQPMERNKSNLHLVKDFMSTMVMAFEKDHARYPARLAMTIVPELMLPNIRSKLSWPTLDSQVASPGRTCTNQKTNALKTRAPKPIQMMRRDRLKP